MIPFRRNIDKLWLQKLCNSKLEKVKEEGRKEGREGGRKEDRFKVGASLRSLGLP